MNVNDPMNTAQALPSGARFYRCALQVNPFEYLTRHHKQTPYPNEASYNAALIEKCQALGIEVIAVTDHYRVQSAASLRAAARAAGLHVFPGFEAVTKEGVHILCLFDTDQDVDKLERIIGACGIHEDNIASPVGEHDVLEFLQKARDWGAVCIAAHVASNGGLLVTLQGQSRINAWRSPHLLACSLPGPVSNAPDNPRPILENKNADYRRDRPIAILNSQDVNGPDDLAKPGASCWIKMSKVSVEGLRQAFLDPKSRIRLASEPVAEEHAEFVAMTWQGGFLDGAAVHFNENLNVLIGGRGTGKSTVVESLRYVLGLEPLGEDARKTHEGIVRQVLKSGTKTSLLVRSHRPSQCAYRIERTVPNPPVVRNEEGKVLDLTPADVISGVEVYGQHEISELTKSPQKLTRLLERFMERDVGLENRKRNLKRELERSRTRILEARKELKEVEDRLASLPALEEMLRRFQEAGLEERLKEQSLLVREERVLKSADERLEPFQTLLERLRQELPIDRAFLSPRSLENLPGKDILAGADEVMARLSQALDIVANQMSEALERANKDLAAISQRWESERQRTVQEAYQKILRELQKSRVDGEEFIRMRQQIENLRPLKERQAALQRDEKELQERRRNVLAEWEDTKAEEFRQLERAAKKVSRQLAERVRVRVSFAGNREPLFELLRGKVAGRLSEAIEALRTRENLSLKELADALRAGGEVLAKKFGLPPAQADRLAQSPPEVVMQLEELDLFPTTTIELNLAAEGASPVWQPLDQLSTGQKATAVLLLVLLESDAPLIIDQPEDDLDNRFITEGIVPKMRDEKRRRQFVFTTHNANIPVLGDAELIVGLRASGEASEGHAEIPVECMGSIDVPAVRELVEELLEGGKEAFEMRRLKYGF
jgi:energy-coupling factor transporter ATP-binding protein EcfA2